MEGKYYYKWINGLVIFWDNKGNIVHKEHTEEIDRVEDVINELQEEGILPIENFLKLVV